MADDRDWERKLIQELAAAGLTEQRRARRWRIFFRFVFAGIALAFLFAGYEFGSPGHGGAGKGFTALVDLQGVLDAEAEANADDINHALRAAFEDSATRGVVLRVNSPGGSPVQAGIIADEIKRLRAKSPSIPLYVVVEDICASGGYYVASVADKIFVDKASIVGSIGVLMDGFGFSGVMDKLGVERRLLTAGKNKGFLDPFSPQDETHRQHAQLLLDDIHEQFIRVVREGRGARLKETPDMFSGLMWTGAKSIEMGLADEVGSLDYVAREIIKAEDIQDFTVRQSFAQRFAKKVGVGIGEGAARLTFGQSAPR